MTAERLIAVLKGCPCCPHIEECEVSFRYCGMYTPEEIDTADKLRSTFYITPRGKWVTKPENRGYMTPGGNPIYYCSVCDYCYGSNEIYPSKNRCRRCGAEMEFDLIEIEMEE